MLSVPGDRLLICSFVGRGGEGGEFIWRVFHLTPVPPFPVAFILPPQLPDFRRRRCALPSFLLASVVAHRRRLWLSLSRTLSPSLCLSRSRSRSRSCARMSVSVSVSACAIAQVYRATRWPLAAYAFVQSGRWNQTVIAASLVHLALLFLVMSTPARADVVCSCEY